VSPDGCVLSDDGGVLGPDVILGSVRGKLHCSSSESAPKPTLNPAVLPEEEEEEVEEHPVNNHIEPNEELSYLFRDQNHEFRLQIPADWTVFQVKELIAMQYHTIADYISLVFYSRNLKDESLFISQIIRDEAIMVYVRQLEITLLKTMGYGGRSEVAKPEDFLQHVRRLEQGSHLDIRICSRALIFYDYNVDRALRALKRLDTE
jgi:hypothetical protein